MKASRDRFANLLHRPTELARRYHTMISTWSGDAESGLNARSRWRIARGGSSHDFTCYIDADDPELAQTKSASAWFGHARAALARRTKPSGGTAWQMQLRRTWTHHQVRRT